MGMDINTLSMGMDKNTLIILLLPLISGKSNSPFDFLKIKNTTI